MIAYTLVREKRKTVRLTVKNGEVFVYAPIGAPKARLDAFVSEKESWIVRRLQADEKAMAAASAAGKLTREDLRDLVARAKTVIPDRVRYFAPMVGVEYEKITVRFQKTRWGSCSSKGNLNFNCLLLLAPPEVLDSVVVHELCHRKEMNHSPAFWREVYRVFPKYDEADRWLKENGPVLTARLPD